MTKELTDREKTAKISRHHLLCYDIGMLIKEYQDEVGPQAFTIESRAWLQDMRHRITRFNTMDDNGSPRGSYVLTPSNSHYEKELKDEASRAEQRTFGDPDDVSGD